MKFIIGTTNQAKVKAALKVIDNHFPGNEWKAEKVPSNVRDQPFGDEETRLGAINRAKHAAEKMDGWIGIGLEGGVRTIENQTYVCNWGALSLPDGTIITAAGAQIPLPEEIAVELRKGRELGIIVDEYFQKSGIRQHEGAIGMFTSNVVTRDLMFEHIMQLLIGQLKVHFYNQ